VPSDPAGRDITRLLREWRGGDGEALERLIPLVHDELHELAARHLSRERRGHTLQPTALVNEAYLKLAGQPGVDWQSRAHFFAIAATVMRRILVDHARRKRSRKRGAGAATMALDDLAVESPRREVDVFDAYALDRALTRLERLDERQARVVELRYFGGMTVEETAEVVGSSPATIYREWAVARAWLYRELAGPAAPGEP
jgi:RNA polymerase sigma factor (TIGR02999 family)